MMLEIEILPREENSVCPAIWHFMNNKRLNYIIETNLKELFTINNTNSTYCETLVLITKTKINPP